MRAPMFLDLAQGHPMIVPERRNWCEPVLALGGIYRLPTHVENIDGPDCRRSFCPKIQVAPIVPRPPKPGVRFGFYGGKTPRQQNKAQAEGITKTD